MGKCTPYNKCGKRVGWWLDALYGGGTVSLNEKINSFRSANSPKTYVQKVSTVWRIWSPFSSEFAQFYDTQKEISTDDDYWALDGAWGLMAYYQIELPSATSGTFTNTTSSQSYTTQVGAYVQFTTTGKWTGLKISHYSDNRGGVWRATINGANPVDFSTYDAGTLFKLSSVYSNISGVSGDIIRLTFQGADPLNPPSGGTARGWVCRDSVTVSNAGRYQKAFYIVGSENPNCCHETMTIAHTKYSLAYAPSHKEFAWSTRARSGTTAVQNQWIPNHSAINTTEASKFANLSTDRTLKIDGGVTDYLTSLTDAFVFAVGGDTIVLSEIYKGCNIDDEPLDLVDFNNQYIWTKDGFRNHTIATILVDLYNSALYASIVESAPTYQSHIISNGVETASNINTGGGFNQIVSRAAIPAWNGNVISIKKTGTDFEKSLCMSMRMINPSSALYMSNNYSQIVKLEGNGNRAKIYPTISDNQPVDAGIVVEWDTYYTIGIVPDAYNELKSYVGL